MYKFKVHCRDTVLHKMGKPVFVEISEKNKEMALEEVKKLFPTLKPKKAYFVCEVSEKETAKVRQKTNN
jgi:hypothetical protein